VRNCSPSFPSFPGGGTEAPRLLMLELLNSAQVGSGVISKFLHTPQHPQSRVSSAQHRPGAFFPYSAHLQGRLSYSRERLTRGCLELRARRIEPAHASGRRVQMSAMSERLGAVPELSRDAGEPLQNHGKALAELTAASTLEAAVEPKKAAPDGSLGGSVGGSLNHRAERYGVLEALLQGSVGGCGVIDGGLATELERRGANINDPLWSAKCLLEDESADLVRQVRVPAGL